MEDLTVNGQIILEETHNEEYEPTDVEIRDYARLIGIDPDYESDLMYIAKIGIKAPLPKDWKACQDVNKDIYYFNFATGESLWDHPCDEYYRHKVELEREKKVRSLHLKSNEIKSEISSSDSINNFRSENPMNLTHPVKVSNSKIRNENYENVPFQELKIIPQNEIKYYFNVEENSEQSNSDVISKQTCGSKSEDYGKDINFGLDKSLTDRLDNANFMRDSYEQMSLMHFSEGGIPKINNFINDSKRLTGIDKSENYERLKFNDLKIEDNKKIENTSLNHCESDIFQSNNQRPIKKKENPRKDILDVISTEKESSNQERSKEINNNLHSNLNYKIKVDSTKLSSNSNDYETGNMLEDSNLKFQERVKNLNILHENQLLELKAYHEKYLFDMKSKFENDKSSLLQEQDNELLNINEDHNKKLQNSQITFNKNMKALRNETASTESKLSEIKAELNEKIRILNHYENEIAKCKNDKKQETNTLNSNLLIHSESKIELKHLKSELIQKKSELQSLNMEIDNLYHIKRNLISEIETKRKYIKSNYGDSTPHIQLDSVPKKAKCITNMLPKDLGDSAVLLDDLEYSGSEDNEIDYSLNQSLLSKLNHKLVLKTKCFLNKSHSNDFAIKSIKSSNVHRSKSLPSMIELERVKSDIEKDSQMEDYMKFDKPKNLLASLEKIKFDLNQVMGILKQKNNVSEFDIPKNYVDYPESDNIFKLNSNASQLKSANEILKLKWIKYFGDKYGKQKINTKSNSISDMSLTKSKASYPSVKLYNERGITTEEKLQQHKTWIDKFQMSST